MPLPPQWMQRQQQGSAASENRNINDIYWQKPDGWIIVGPSAVPGANGRPLTAQAEGWMRRGYTPLIEYSYTDRISDKTGHRETIDTNSDRLNTPDRYYWLFRNGGAHLFTIEQIVSHHWHITPPYGLPKTAFPQLAEYEVPEPYWCPACAGTKPPRNSVEEVINHLMIEHRMNLPQVRDLQSSTNDFTDTPRAASGLAIRRKAHVNEQEVTARMEAPIPEPVHMNICNECGGVIEGTDGFAKARHNKTYHKPGEPSEQTGEEG